MAHAFEFRVGGKSVAQPRQKFQAVFSAAQGRHVPVPYRDDSSPVHTFKGEVRLAARLSRPNGWPIGPGWAYRLLCVFAVKPPARFPKRRPWGMACNKKPDLDNLVKAVKDALKDITWDDDGRVFDARLIKVYPDAAEPASLRVVLQAVPDRVVYPRAAVNDAIAEWAAQTFEGK